MVVRGLKALHDLDIMHRDLKSANVFLNKDDTGKLGDMNVSKVAEKGLSYTQTGTPYYASPEVWRDEAYDIKSDIWSLGCVLYEMITLKPPFRAENMQGLYKKVLRGNYPKISKQYTPEIQGIVKQLLQVSPKKRPNCTEILANSVVKKKIKEIFPDENYDDETETETLKNSLLKTIYFPKDGQDILYLTDKLPKPSYDTDLEKIVDIHKMSNRTRATSESPNFPNLPKDSINLPQKYKRPKETSMNKSNISETAEGTELPATKLKKVLNSDRKEEKKAGKMPELILPSYHKNPSKMTSVERIAKRLELESQKKPVMNIDKEYNNLQRILGKKQQDLGNDSSRISKKIAIEKNKLKNSSLQEHPKYLRERPLYSNRGQPKYQRPSHNSQNRYGGEANKAVLNLGIVGEQVGASSARRGGKGNSLDMRLPKIADGILKSKGKAPKGLQKSINTLKLPKLQKYKHGKYYADNDKIYSNKYSNIISKKPSKSYRYKHGGKAPKEAQKRDKTIDKLKMYKD
mmetsp:Transcript_19254/g.18939  ORF Transcript_19254/g.18939 Transcript_19254/m.18939 type:complete len:517 (-) Transcript_19254:64-1614(-)